MADMANWNHHAESYMALEVQCLGLELLVLTLDKSLQVLLCLHVIACIFLYGSECPIFCGC